MMFVSFTYDGRDAKAPQTTNTSACSFANSPSVSSNHASSCRPNLRCRKVARELKKLDVEEHVLQERTVWGVPESSGSWVDAHCFRPVSPVRKQECDARGRKPKVIVLWDVARKKKGKKKKAPSDGGTRAPGQDTATATSRRAPRARTTATFSHWALSLLCSVLRSAPSSSREHRVRPDLSEARGHPDSRLEPNGGTTGRDSKTGWSGAVPRSPNTAVASVPDVGKRLNVRRPAATICVISSTLRWMSRSGHHSSPDG